MVMKDHSSRPRAQPCAYLLYALLLSSSVQTPGVFSPRALPREWPATGEPSLYTGTLCLDSRATSKSIAVNGGNRGLHNDRAVRSD